MPATMAHEGEEIYRLDPDGLETDKHVYPDGQWVFFGDAGPQPVDRVMLELQSQEGTARSIVLRFWCSAERIPQIPDPGEYDFDIFVVDPALTCAVEMTMKPEVVDRFGAVLLALDDWNKRATYEVDGAFPAVDLRGYVMTRFAQFQGGTT